MFPYHMSLTSIDTRLDRLLLSCEPPHRGAAKKNPKKKQASLKYNPNWPRDRNLSQALSNCLRHAPDAAIFDAGGWVAAGDFIDAVRDGMPSSAYTPEEIRTFIDSQEGRDKRCEWKERDGALYVRCFQGHSPHLFAENGGNIQRDALYERFREPPRYAVFHSTTVEAAAAIKKTGLRPGGEEEGGRDINLWHLAGEKKGRALEKVPVTVKVDVAAAMGRGIPFWIAGNGVILTDMPIPREFLSFFEITDGVIPEDDPFFTEP